MFHSCGQARPVMRLTRMPPEPANPAGYLPATPKDIDHYHALASFFGGYARWDDAARSFITKVADCSRSSW